MIQNSRSVVYFFILTERNIGTEKYVYYSTLVSWSNAQRYCRQHHTDLTSSRDATENSLIMGKIPQVNVFNWFGLFRNSWMWSDGTKSTFIVWAEDQPIGNENCVNIYKSEAFNSPCSDVKPFFCHSGDLQLYFISYSDKFIFVFLLESNVNCMCTYVHFCSSASKKTENHQVEGSIQSGYESSCNNVGRLGDGEFHPSQ